MSKSELELQVLYIWTVPYTDLLLPIFNLTTNHGQNYRYFTPCSSNTEPVWNLILNPIRMLSFKINFFHEPNEPFYPLPLPTYFLLFALQIVNQKINYFLVQFDFFFQNMIAIVETIPEIIFQNFTLDLDLGLSK